MHCFFERHRVLFSLCVFLIYITGIFLQSTFCFWSFCRLTCFKDLSKVWHVLLSLVHCLYLPVCYTHALCFSYPNSAPVNVLIPFFSGSVYEFLCHTYPKIALRACRPAWVYFPFVCLVGPQQCTRVQVSFSKSLPAFGGVQLLHLQSHRAPAFLWSLVRLSVIDSFVLLPLSLSGWSLLVFQFSAQVHLSWMHPWQLRLAVPCLPIETELILSCLSSRLGFSSSASSPCLWNLAQGLISRKCEGMFGDQLTHLENEH